jgi:hypothetical protein
MIYGAYLPLAKQQAILLGDLSNTIVHPYFVHFSNLAGCQFYRQNRKNHDFLYIQAVHLKSTLDSLASMKEEEDPLQVAQANFWMGRACVYAQRLRWATHYLKKSVQIMRRNNNLLPTSKEDSTQAANLGFPAPEFSEEVHERAAFLAQALSYEICIYFAGQPDTVVRGLRLADGVNHALLVSVILSAPS